MIQPSQPDVVNLFKEVYGKLQNLLPEDYLLQTMIPFNSAQKVGEKYIEAVVLTNETGWSLLGSQAIAYELNPAIAGSVQQAEVTPYSTVLASLIPWTMISRTNGTAQSFMQVTKHVVKNNIRSHSKLLEIIRIYGQAAGLLGYVSFYSGTYRGQSFVNGTGTVNGVTFTNGVNVTTNQILFNKGTFAAGIWVGTEGAVVQEVNAAGTVLQEGNLVSVDPENGYITVSFVPTAATSVTSHRLCFKGQATANDAIGIVNILSNTGVLFGISTSAYSLWKGNTINMNSKALASIQPLQLAISSCVARGGLDGDIDVFVNPRTWARLSNNEAGQRVYDDSYNEKQAKNGFEAIQYWSQTGKLTIHAHRMVKEGEALGLHIPDWSRSGSAEVSFSVPGMDGAGDLIFPVQNMNCYAFRTYSDQYVFCHGPAKSFYMYGIDDEAA